MVKKVILARPRGFCAGVDRAIDVVEAALEIFGPPIYVKHAIVHNIHVVGDLEKKGVVFVEDLDGICPKSVIIFSAHGTTPNLKNEVIRKGYKVIDATCPLVTKVHLEAKRYVREGYFIIYIGHRNHPEPIGVFGEVSSDSIVLVENVDEVAKIKVPQREKLIYLTQTTLSLGDVGEIIEALKSRFKNIITPPSSDICYATFNRQIAVRELAKKCDLVLVVGSKASSNSQRLISVCKKEGTCAYLIDDEKMIKPDWFKNVTVCGLTSGASAPEYLIKNIIDFIKKMSKTVKVENLDVLGENIKFPLPDDLVSLAKKSGKAKFFVEKHKIESQY